MPEDIKLTGGRSDVKRRGDLLLRKAEHWSASVQFLLKHLEQKGFSGAPRVISPGIDHDGWETLSFIEGDIVHPKPWSDEGIVTIGLLLKKLHDATSDFMPPRNAIWRPWFGRDLGNRNKIYGHCDFAPWNIISNNNIPFAVIDWENAGPVDPMIELAHACWLNVQLVDDDVAERAGLAPIENRIHQLKLMFEAYGLPKTKKDVFMDALISIVVCDAADQAIEANITPDCQDAAPLWGLAWRARSAAWIIRNQKSVEKAFT
jgi:hypothetical protein